MKMTKAQAEQYLQSVGIDTTGWDWRQMARTILALLLQLLSEQKPTLKSGQTCDPDCCECCKLHFEMIEAVAACGIDCCDGGPPTP